MWYQCNTVVKISIHALLAESDAAFGGLQAALSGDFYPRSPCGERLCRQSAILRTPLISIHALLAESDIFKLGNQSITVISIHALLAESDANRLLQPSRPHAFLSTLSLRRATTTANEALQKVKISIHALLAESDTSRLHKILADWDFYPRSPCGERRWSVDVPGWILGISIHALLAESDPRHQFRHQ